LQKQVQTDMKNDSVSKETLLNHVNALNKAKTDDTQKDKQLNYTLAKGIRGPITKPFQWELTTTRKTSGWKRTTEGSTLFR
jgi:hypothetical protein